MLLSCRPLMIFAAAVVLFHLANAAMLPLVGQKLALQDKNLGTTLMSACIVAAQIVMVPMAMLVGARADRWGRKPLFLAGFLILPLRGCLYTLSDNQFWLVGRADARWRRRRAFWRVVSGYRGRPDARHRPLQCRAGRDPDRARHRRRAVDDTCRRRGRECRLQRRLSDAWRPSRLRAHWFSSSACRRPTCIPANEIRGGKAKSRLRASAAADSSHRLKLCGTEATCNHTTTEAIYIIAALATAGVILRPFNLAGSGLGSGRRGRCW